eukprot:scaffold377_cov57-Phaeocystis_antarctica.AAC.4
MFAHTLALEMVDAHVARRAEHSELEAQRRKARRARLAAVATLHEVEPLTHRTVQPHRRCRRRHALARRALLTARERLRRTLLAPGLGLGGRRRGRRELPCLKRARAPRHPRFANDERGGAVRARHGARLGPLGNDDVRHLLLTSKPAALLEHQRAELLQPCLEHLACCVQPPPLSQDPRHAPRRHLTLAARSLRRHHPRRAHHARRAATRSRRPSCHRCRCRCRATPLPAPLPARKGRRHEPAVGAKVDGERRLGVAAATSQ